MPLPRSLRYAEPEEASRLSAEHFVNEARRGARKTYPERRADGSVWEITYDVLTDEVLSERMVEPPPRQPVPEETQGYGPEFESQGPTYDPVAARARAPGGASPIAQAMASLGRGLGTIGAGLGFGANPALEETNRRLREQVPQIEEPTIPTPFPGRPRMGITEAYSEIPGADLYGTVKNIPKGVSLALETDPIRKLTSLIREAKPAREATEALKSAELRSRVGQAAGILEGGKGEEAFRASTAALRGELPKAPFEAPRSSFAPDELMGLFEQVRTSGKSYFTKLHTQEALSTLLTGDVPTRSQIGYLEDFFGADLAKAIKGRDVSKWASVRETLIDVANVPRTLVASVDISAPLRQGAIFAVGHPKEWLSAWKPMLKAFASEKYALQVDEALRERPFIELAERARLYLAPIAKGTGRALIDQEEQFMSRLARKIPLVRASERAYVTFLNKLRYDVFENVAKEWETMGKGEQSYRSLAGYINAATGRGNLGKFEQAADILNAGFFSPRFVVSRFQAPAYVFSKDKELRKMVANDLVKFVGTGAGILSLAALGGAEVNLDPRNPDFGRIKVGNTRIDFWGGFQPVARYTAQFFSGTGVSSRTGKEYAADPVHTMARFIESKLAPTPSLLLNLMRGKTFTGEEVTPANQAFSTLVPLFLQDIKESVEEYGLLGLPIGGLSGVGIGVQTYGEEGPLGVPAAPSSGFQKLRESTRGGTNRSAGFERLREQQRSGPSSTSGFQRLREQSRNAR